MSPVVMVVFVPVVLLVIAFVSVLLGAAAAGGWERLERGLPDGEPAPGAEPLSFEMPPARPRAA